MSPLAIAAVIVVALTLLTSYALVFQNLEKKRKQRQRLITALKLRCSNFKYMLSGFPPDFLTKDLAVLVCRCLIDTIEQLAKLEPDDPNHIEDLQIYHTKLAETQSRENSVRRVTLENPAQVGEIRNQLQELHRFVERRLRSQAINAAQALAYSRQIQKLILQVSIDGYMHQAKQAQQTGKTRLVIHFYSLARRLLMRENSENAYSKQIAQLDAVIKQAEAKLIEENANTGTVTASAPVEVAKQWDQFEDAAVGWKKKTLYD